jgi:hypothetical protein
LVGHTDQSHGRIRSTFEGLPDVPVSAFSLEIFGGKHGIFESSESLCAAAQRINVRLVGQNGKTTRANQSVAVARCAKKGRRQRRHRHPRRGLHQARRAER